MSEKKMTMDPQEQARLDAEKQLRTSLLSGLAECEKLRAALLDARSELARRDAALVDPHTLLENPPHPMQPIVWHQKPDGKTIRFKPNEIVRALLDQRDDPARKGERPLDLNDIARMDFSQEDRMQFAQLIGYSVSGFGSLSYAHPETVAAADRIAEALLVQDEGTP